MENKRIGFEFTVRGQQSVFTPEQILGFYLKKLGKFYEASGIISREIVLSVPSYYSNVER